MKAEAITFNKLSHVLPSSPQKTLLVEAQVEVEVEVEVSCKSIAKHNFDIVFQSAKHIKPTGINKGQSQVGKAMASA